MDTTNPTSLSDSLLPQPDTIVLDLHAIEHLKQTRKWTNFLSIAAFVMLGLMMVVVVIVTSMTFFSRPGIMSLMPVIPLTILVVIYFFPIYYLYQFSKFAKHATLHHDGTVLTRALQYLQKHYRFMGILLIILMGFYLVMGIVALATGSLMHLFR